MQSPLVQGKYVGRNGCDDNAASRNMNSETISGVTSSTTSGFAVSFTKMRNSVAAHLDDSRTALRAQALQRHYLGSCFFRRGSRKPRQKKERWPEYMYFSATVGALLRRDLSQSSVGLGSPNRASCVSCPWLDVEL